MRQYGIDRVELSWFGLDLKPGLAQGSSITEARTVPSWTTKPTGNGRVVRVYNPDKSGTVSILVDQESEVHKQLRALAQTDAVSRNVVGPMVLRDLNSGEVFYYQNAFITTEPDEIRGTESQTFTWVFAFERVEHVSTPATFNQNLVGN